VHKCVSICEVPVCLPYEFCFSTCCFYCFCCICICDSMVFGIALDLVVFQKLISDIGLLLLPWLLPTVSKTVDCDKQMSVVESGNAKLNNNSKNIKAQSNNSSKINVNSNCSISKVFTIWMIATRRQLQKHIWCM